MNECLIINKCGCKFITVSVYSSFYLLLFFFFFLEKLWLTINLYMKFIYFVLVLGFLATLYNFCNINSFIGLLTLETHTSFTILYTLYISSSSFSPSSFSFLSAVRFSLFFVIFFPKFSNSFSFKKAFLYFISLNANCDSDSEANLCHWLFSKLLPSLPFFHSFIFHKTKKAWVKSA